MNDKEEELKKVIMDLEEERRDLEDANIELCKRLCESNDEIREAHEELISVIFFPLLECSLLIVIISCVTYVYVSAGIERHIG